MYYEPIKNRKVEIAIIFVFLLAICIILIKILFNMNSNLETNYEVQKTSLNTEKNEDYNNIKNTIKKAVSCIVGISKLEDNGTSIFLNDVTSTLGLGSGVIVSENGYIVTNQHLVGDKYSNCYVTLENGEHYTGNVVWADSNIDLAIVKIPSYKLDYIELGDSDNIYLGENVYAIGNPIGFEFQRTVTKGIISGINRTLKIENETESSYMEDLIQTDSTINEGNSGGALINEKGDLIGINSIKLKSAEGIGFAVPINIIKPIIEKFQKNGKFEECYLGIFGYDKEVIPYLEKNIEIDSGIYVAQIIAGGTISDTNIKEGDIITKINNVDINKMCDLRKYIYKKNPGDEVILHVKRKNKEWDIAVKLNKRRG